MELKSLQILEKQVKVARKVLQKSFQSGMGDSSTVQVFLQEMSFLRKEPVCASPFPSHMSELFHAEATNKAWPAGEFWSQMANSEMFADYAAKDQIPSLQHTYFYDKVMGLVQTSDIAEAVSNLRSLVSGFKDINCFDFHSDMVDNVKALGSIVFAPNYPESMGAQDRADLLSASISPQSILSNALAKFKTGQTILSKAGEIAKSLEAKNEKLEKIPGLWKDACDNATTLPVALASLSTMVEELGEREVASAIAVELLFERRNEVFNKFLALLLQMENGSSAADVQLWKSTDMNDALKVLAAFAGKDAKTVISIYEQCEFMCAQYQTGCLIVKRLL